MDDKELERLLQQSAISALTLSDNKESLRNVLMNLKRPYRRYRKARLWSIAVILSGVLLTAAAVFLVVEDNDSPGPTNNLGGIWATYTDSLEGGSSKVWPPVSSSCRNLFVKSAPGFGGKGYAVRITGTTGTTASPYLGVSTYLSERATCPRCIGIDLRMYKGIRFKMKGTSGQGRLFFILPHESRTASQDRTHCLTLTGYNDYQADITGLVKKEWKVVSLTFRKDFNQPLNTPSPQKVDIEKVLEDENQIKWKWVGDKNQQIDLWIDDVELF
jgi:hypothetical protein